MSLTSGPTTQTRVRAMSSHRTTTSPTCKRDWALVNADYVADAWTLNLSTVKRTALLKPPQAG